MYKATLLTLTFAATLLGDDGYALYQKHCASCHIESLSKTETKKRFASLKAPPMIEVANRLKENIIIADEDEDVKRRVVIAFIKEYVQNPDLLYSMCHPMAIEKFGQMPSLKGKLTPQELEAVAAWVYDHYEGKQFE
ncbi:MAG: cytochrome c [Campylobacterales bacterium]|nr:cytochrome c [Campylobacterales bacterium]